MLCLSFFTNENGRGTSEARASVLILKAILTEILRGILIDSKTSTFAHDSSTFAHDDVYFCTRFIYMYTTVVSSTFAHGAKTLNCRRLRTVVSKFAIVLLKLTALKRR